MATPGARCSRRRSSLECAIRYDETKADLVHDEEFEAVLFPLTDPVDVSALIPVDYDDRDLQDRGAGRCRVPS